MIAPAATSKASSDYSVEHKRTPRTGNKRRVWGGWVGKWVGWGWRCAVAAPLGTGAPRWMRTGRRLCTLAPPASASALPKFQTCNVDHFLLLYYKALIRWLQQGNKDTAAQARLAAILHVARPPVHHHVPDTAAAPGRQPCPAGPAGRHGIGDRNSGKAQHRVCESGSPPFLHPSPGLAACASRASARPPSARPHRARWCGTNTPPPPPTSPRSPATTPGHGGGLRQGGARRRRRGVD